MHKGLRKIEKMGVKSQKNSHSILDLLPYSRYNVRYGNLALSVGELKMEVYKAMGFILRKGGGYSRRGDNQNMGAARPLTA